MADNSGEPEKADPQVQCPKVCGTCTHSPTTSEICDILHTRRVDCAQYFLHVQDDTNVQEELLQQRKNLRDTATEYHNDIVNTVCDQDRLARQIAANIQKIEHLESKLVSNDGALRAACSKMEDVQVSSVITSSMCKVHTRGKLHPQTIITSADHHPYLLIKQN